MLDHGTADIAENLTQLYLFRESELQKAMIERSKAPLDGLKKVMMILLEVWEQVELQAAAA